jgi:hypothetical protein
MWIVIIVGFLVGLVFEGFAIAMSGDMEDPLSVFGALSFNVIGAVMVWGIFNSGRTKVPFWLILVILEAILFLALTFLKVRKIITARLLREKAEDERRKAEDERRKAEVEAQRRKEQEQAEDENRIKAHMPIIRASAKYSAFSQFYLQNLPEISQIRVYNGWLTARFYVDGIRYVPDYRQGIMVIDPSQPNTTRSFFGQAADERAWMVFEAEALARLIDEAVKPTGNFSLGHKAMGHREYNRIAPATPVIAKTPY